MRRHLSAVLLSVLPALSGAALAQDDVLTAAGSGSERRLEAGLVAPAAVCWYNGDIDYRNGFTSERNTMVHESWTYDDVVWDGGVVTGARAHFVINPGTVIVGGDLIIYQGMSEGNFGRLIREVSDITDFKFTRTGIRAFNRDEYRLELTLGHSAFRLDPGEYHVGIRCIGSGQGQAFVVVTSGENAIGTPPGNNGRTFLCSSFQRPCFPTDWRNLVGPGTWDVSYGLDCRPSAYTLSLSGQCPGLVRVEWSGAEPDRRQGILFAFDVGNYTLPTGPCEGTELGLGASGLRLMAVISTGAGSGAVSGATGSQCQGYAQLITISSCATSNVARVP